MNTSTNTSEASYFSRCRAFAHQHDDIPAFHAAYFIMIVLSAALLNLGAFAVLILIHMILDVVKYRDFHDLPMTAVLQGVIRESLVDVTFLVVGVALGVYLHHSTGIEALSSIFRIEASLLRATALFFPKVKILHHFLQMILHLPQYMHTIHPRHRGHFSVVDKACFGTLLFAFVLLLLAPSLTGVAATGVRDTIWEQFVF